MYIDLYRLRLGVFLARLGLEAYRRGIPPVSMYTCIHVYIYVYVYIYIYMHRLRLGMLLERLGLTRYRYTHI